MDRYEQVREQVVPGLSKVLENKPLDHAGDWTDLDRRLRRMWNAALRYASEKAGISIKDNGDGYARGFNDACKKIEASILEEIDEGL